MVPSVPRAPVAAKPLETDETVELHLKRPNILDDLAFQVNAIDKKLDILTANLSTSLRWPNPRVSASSSHSSFLSRSDQECFGNSTHKFFDPDQVDLPMQHQCSGGSIFKSLRTSMNSWFHSSSSRGLEGSEHPSSPKRKSRIDYNADNGVEGYEKPSLRNKRSIDFNADSMSVGTQFESEDSNQKSQPCPRGSARSSASMLSSMMQSQVLKKQRKRNNTEVKLWNLLEHSESSQAAVMLNKVVPIIIITTVLTSLSQGPTPPDIAQPEFIMWTEVAIDGIFAIEFLIRFLVCPNRWSFWFDINNLVDSTAIFTLAFRIHLLCRKQAVTVLNSFQTALLTGFVPVLRLMKMLRRFTGFHLLKKAFKLSVEAMPVLIFMFVALLLFFTVLLFCVEVRTNPDVDSLAQAMWLASVSMTTVGYGDVTPKTAAGKLFISILVVATNLYMAIPIGILGSCFSEVWNDRDRELLTQCVRNRLAQSGFSASDLPELFSAFDKHGDNTIQFKEFRKMVHLLKLGLDETRLRQLFDMFDTACCGSIGEQQFVKGIFPDKYHDMYFGEGR